MFGRDESFQDPFQDQIAWPCENPQSSFDQTSSKGGKNIHYDTQEFRDDRFSHSYQIQLNKTPVKPQFQLDFKINQKQFFEEDSLQLNSLQLWSPRSNLIIVENQMSQNHQLDNSIQILEESEDEMLINHSEEIIQISQTSQIEISEQTQDSSVSEHPKQDQNEYSQIIRILIKDKSWKTTEKKRFQEFLRINKNVINFVHFLAQFSYEFHAYLQQLYELKSLELNKQDYRLGQKRYSRYLNFNEFEIETKVFEQNMESIKEDLTNIKQDIMLFIKIYKDKLTLSQIQPFKKLKANVVDSLEKIRNRIECRNSKKNQKERRQDFEKHFQNPQEFIQLIIQTYDKKLENLPNKRNQIMARIDSLKSEFFNKLNSLQSQ